MLKYKFESWDEDGEVKETIKLKDKIQTSKVRSQVSNAKGIRTKDRIKKD